MLVMCSMQLHWHKVIPYVFIISNTIQLHNALSKNFRLHLKIFKYNNYTQVENKATKIYVFMYKNYFTWVHKFVFGFLTFCASHKEITSLRELVFLYSLLELCCQEFCTLISYTCRSYEFWFGWYYSKQLQTNYRY